ncbi:hypothetical protein ACH4OW_11445 [Streptomyces sp. NPDC017056]|uniref:hypothetical protein n=1 Tax=Streptomyces sp. NPDC017056 TaxID=3364973 RepID=UPI00379783EC
MVTRREHNSRRRLLATGVAAAMTAMTAAVATGTVLASGPAFGVLAHLHAVREAGVLKP